MQSAMVLQRSLKQQSAAQALQSCRWTSKVVILLHCWFSTCTYEMQLKGLFSGSMNNTFRLTVSGCLCGAAYFYVACYKLLLDSLLAGVSWPSHPECCLLFDHDGEIAQHLTVFLLGRYGLSYSEMLVFRWCEAHWLLDYPRCKDDVDHPGVWPGHAR